MASFLDTLFQWPDISLPDWLSDGQANWPSIPSFQPQLTFPFPLSLPWLDQGAIAPLSVASPTRRQASQDYAPITVQSPLRRQSASAALPVAGATVPAEGLTTLEQAIDAATDDPRIRQAMRLAALLEGGNLEGNWGVGDEGQSFGPYQIYTRVHNVTREQAENPEFATRYMLPEFQRALARVDPGLWDTDPAKAASLLAYYAERPAKMYDPSRVQAAYGTLSGRAASAAATPQASQGLQAAAIAEATKHIGTPYLLAGQANNPRAGAFDCSGLVQWAYGQAGARLPRVAQDQYNATARVSAADVRPGDLVFFTNTYNAGTPVTHVGIYLGGNRMLQAGSGGVGYADMSAPYWRSRLYGFGRVGS